MLLSSVGSSLYAQGFDCGTTEPASPPSNGSSTESTCFDQSAIIANCTPVYIRMNFHFFVNNDCSGSFDVNSTGPNDPDWPQTEAFQDPDRPFQHGYPEFVVNAMNAKMANNLPQKLAGGVFAPTAPCIPIRFVVGDVRIHCNQAHKNTTSWSTLQSSYGQFARPGLNVYYSRPSVTGATGQANGIPGTAARILVDDTKNLLHEAGHVLGLAHTFPGPNNDGCLDTPAEGVDWDKNCDGSIVGNERNPCGNLFPPTDPWCTGTHCSNGAAILSPCCDPNNVYNNLMGYKADDVAITECQIGKMLSALNTSTLCPWVVAIGNCGPPAAAVVGFVPQEQIIDDCSFCLQGAASMNETEFRWQVSRVESNGSLTLFLDTGWKAGEAGELCLSPDAQRLGHRISKNTTYSVTLRVLNECTGEDTNTIRFTTPAYGCDDDIVVGGPIDIPPDDPKIYPNPGSGSGTVFYEASLTNAGPVTLRASRVNAIDPPAVIYSNNNQPAGPFTIEVSTATWQNGVYRFQLQTNAGVMTTNFVKQ
jgi:hypothetical protein